MLCWVHYTFRVHKLRFISHIALFLLVTNKERWLVELVWNDTSFPSSLTSSPDLPSSSFWFLQLDRRQGFWRWGSKGYLSWPVWVKASPDQNTTYRSCFCKVCKDKGLEFLEVGVAWIQLTCTSLRSEHGTLSLSHPLLGEALEVQRYSLPLKWASTSNTSV